MRRDIPRPSDLAKLKAGRPLMTAREHLEICARMARFDGKIGAAAARGLEHGPDVLRYLQQAERATAVEVARSIASAREAARLMRQLAMLYETGAERAEIAISLREDAASVLVEAALLDARGA